jgi:PPOX class probable F420-dependent enzyme
MSDDEVDAFLRATRKVQVATIGTDGTPHLTTLFHVVDDAGRIAFWTYGRSQKIRNLERDPRISLLVEDGEDYVELRGVSIRGTAELVRDHDAVREVGTAVALRMIGADTPDALGDVGTAEVERQAAKRVAVVVTPTHTASWDHRKLISG